MKDDLKRKVGNSLELRSELLCQAEMVSNIVNDMRGKIIDNLLSPDNVDGCCFGQVDDYLETFDAATKKLKDQFDANQKLIMS